jgi:hypothetical protein
LSSYFQSQLKLTISKIVEKIIFFEAEAAMAPFYALHYLTVPLQTHAPAGFLLHLGRIGFVGLAGCGTGNARSYRRLGKPVRQ